MSPQTLAAVTRACRRTDRLCAYAGMALWVASMALIFLPAIAAVVAGQQP